MTSGNIPALIIVRRAVPVEAGQLSELALRSKSHWGYSPEFIESCKSELKVSPEQLRDEDYSCFVAAQADNLLGYYALEPVSDIEYELDALFVEPDQIGRGVGRLLMEHAIRCVSNAGGKTLTIQGDPHATNFYLAFDASEVGTRESGSIPGRHLPVFEIDVVANSG